MYRIQKTKIFFIIISIFLLYHVNNALAEIKDLSANIIKVNGEVEVLRKGEAAWIKALLKMVLNEGDSIRTKSKSLADMELPDKSILKLGENTQFVISKLNMDTNTTAVTSFFNLLWGRVRAVVTKFKTDESSFAIQTPTAIVGVLGTDYEVLYELVLQMTTVWVYDGIVYVQAFDPAKVRKILKSGYKTIIRLNKPPESPVPFIMDKKSETSVPSMDEIEETPEQVKDKRVKSKLRMLNHLRDGMVRNVSPLTSPQFERDTSPTKSRIIPARVRIRFD